MDICNFPADQEQYADFIFRTSGLGREELSGLYGDICISYVDAEYAIAHLPLSDTLPISVENQDTLTTR